MYWALLSPGERPVPDLSLEPIVWRAWALKLRNIQAILSLHGPSAVTSFACFR